ncbi:MAG: flavodoxin domain-containing protein [Candidatus Odinarchaeota archaeon]
MMNKTILAYATRWGATKETAEVIADILRGKYNIEVDLVDIKDKKNKNLDIRPYDNVILGVSVAIFRWAKEGKKFLKKNRDILPGKKFFVFVSSGGAGEAYEQNDLEKYERLQKKWIDDRLAKFKLHYTSCKAMGGRRTDQNWDNRNWAVIRGWADEIGGIITSTSTQV